MRQSACGVGVGTGGVGTQAYPKDAQIVLKRVSDQDGVCWQQLAQVTLYIGHGGGHVGELLSGDSAVPGCAVGKDRTRKDPLYCTRSL